MSVILSQIVLVFLVSNSPVVHVQAISNFTDVPTCQQAIDIITTQEKDEPVNEQIHQSLRCIKFSYRYDPDGDGPKKPVSTKPEHEPYPCKNPISKVVVACKEASYTE